MFDLDALKKIKLINRGTLMFFLGLDLLIIGASAYIVWNRVQAHWLGIAPSGTSTALPPGSSAQTATEPQAVPAETPAPEEPQPLENSPETATEKPAPKAKVSKHQAAAGPARKILFKYRDSIPKRVVIVGDFNHWSPQLMKKDAKNNWSIVLDLKPGNYAYNFVVDGRMIRDPSNKKSKQAGQKIPSSFLTVKAK